VSDGTYLWVVTDRGILHCLEARTGKEVWGSQRIKPAIYSSSPVLADGRIYITNEAGLTTVIKAGPKFEVLAENDLADYTLSSPAVSDGRIYMRGGRLPVRDRKEVGGGTHACAGDPLLPNGEHHGPEVGRRGEGAAADQRGSSRAVDGRGGAGDPRARAGVRGAGQAESGAVHPAAHRAARGVELALPSRQPVRRPRGK